MNEWRYASVDLTTDLVTITHVPCLVKGWEAVTSISATPVLIKDGAASVLVIPGGRSPGDNRDLREPVRFETNLIVDPDDAATGTVTLFYRLLGYK